MNGEDIIKHGVTAFGAIATMGIVMRLMWEVLRGADAKIEKALKDHCEDDVETFKHIERGLDAKQDKDMCLMEHKSVSKAFEDGREKFRAIVDQQARIQHEVQDTATRLALIAQRLEDMMPKIAAALNGKIPNSSGR
jgi:hypothetical protein